MTDIAIGVVTTLGCSFVNFIATKIYNAATGQSKNFLWKEKKDKLTSLIAPMSLEEIKKRIRIVVIDDEDGFPLKLFQSEGYAIDKLDKVTDNTYGKLESGFYDIIILDIQGVAKDISLDDGLGVLESIKKNNPAQIIIAYSQHSYDLSKARFWELADEKIAKPSDFLKMKGIIDNLINTKYKPERYIQTLHSILSQNNFSKNQISKLDNELYCSYKKSEEPNLKSILAFANRNAELLSQVLNLSKTIYKFFKK